jgi:phosphoribosylformylglycinamidine (FGAM) synthase-like enzyme
MWNGEEVANLPIKELGDEAPEYDRPWVEPKVPAPLPARTCLRQTTWPALPDEDDGLARHVITPLGLGAV